MQTATHRKASPSRRSAACLEQWRTAIARGNSAFGAADYSGSIRHYRLVRTIAERLFARVDDIDAGIAALVVACHNLADAYEHLGRVSEQGSQLCAVHEKLCHAIDDAGLDEPWRSAALRHSQRSYAELLRFVGSHPEHARAQAALALGAKQAAYRHFS